MRLEKNRLIVGDRVLFIRVDRWAKGKLLMQGIMGVVYWRRRVKIITVAELRDVRILWDDENEST